jgi:hypothetical protein
MDPATAMMAMQAAGAAYGVGKKYLPKARRLANHVVHSGAPKSALKYLRKLRTKKGMMKFIKKDARKGLQKVSKLITSGKALRGFNEVAGDIAGAAGTIGNAASGAGYANAGAYGHHIASLANQSSERATHYHQNVEHLNKQATNHISAFKKTYY